MFILCPQCQFLVAIEPATGLPPTRCPRCGHALQSEPQAPSDVEVVAPATTETERELEADRLAESSSAAALDADVLGEAIAQSAAVEAELATEPVPGVSTSATPPPPIAASRDDAASRQRPAADPASPRADAAPPEAGFVEPAPVPPPVRPRRTNAPSFVRVAPAGTLRAARRGPTIATIALLALLLMLQLLVADRARLAADARWRPAIATLCDALRCTLPAWHEPEAFTLVARDVRPIRPGVLHVSASFRNDARWAQAWPALHLALQDVDGRTVGARVFAPREYLGRGVTQNDVAPGQVASVAFDVGEPPGTVVAFTFDFR
jgi:hypothetical protein